MHAMLLINSFWVSSSKLKQKTEERPCSKEKKNRFYVIIVNEKQKQLTTQIKISHSTHFAMGENSLNWIHFG